MASLVIAEHDNVQLKSATLHAVSAARKATGDVHVLVAGSGARGVADAILEGRNQIMEELVKNEFAEADEPAAD